MLNIKCLNQLFSLMAHFSVGVLCILHSHSTLAGGELEALVQLVNPADTTEEIIPYDGRGIRWDKRCLPTNYVLDSDSLPNAGTAAEIDIGTVQSVIAAAMQTWTDVPTSYIEPKIAEVKPIAGAGASFDYVFTITFEETLPGFTETFGVAPSVTLDVDRVMEPGEDLDQDGDSDVYDSAVVGRTDCFDVDGDGDIEFSSGFYLGGTILDADISFNAFTTWTTNKEEVGFSLDTFTTTVDIFSVAIHEIGHSLGLAHSAISKQSDTDGSNAIMFPFLSSNPSAAEASTELGDDDIAWISFIYPEGSSNEGPPALQAGDIAFDQAFDIIEGQVLAAGSPNMLSHVIARGQGANKGVTIGGYSIDPPLNGDVGFTFVNLVPEEVTAENASYFIPVPKGTYTLEVEEIDGAPFAPASISDPAVLASTFDGNETVSDNFFSGNFRDKLERIKQIVLADDVPVNVSSSQNSPANFNLPEVTRVGPTGFASLSISGAAFAGGWVVRRFDREEVLKEFNKGNLLAGTRIFTLNQLASFATDRTSIPTFGAVKLAVGNLDANGELQLEFFDQIVDNFIGDEDDHTYLRLTQLNGLLVQTYLEFVAPDADLYVAVELVPTLDSEGNFSVSAVGSSITLGADSSFTSASLEGPFTPLSSIDFGINLDFRVPSSF